MQKNYTIRATQNFNDQFTKLVRRDAKLKNRIQSRISELANDPYAGTIRLTYRYQGWREDKLGDYRILLAVCEECQEIRDPKLVQCSDCDEMEQETVKLMEVGHRSDMWKHT